jgi:hypothetical protein
MITYEDEIKNNLEVDIEAWLIEYGIEKSHVKMKLNCGSS